MPRMVAVNHIRVTGFWHPYQNDDYIRSATGYVTPLQGFDCDVVLDIMPKYKRSGRVE